MDLPALNEAAGRKRMNTDVENLRQKVARENDNIIKLKVGQDTAYWELKEKLSAKERDHETLQRNMVQLQMEHEALSAQYQDELRRRPETINKTESTRQICDVLEENMNRVRAAMQRSAGDRAALADAYERAGASVTAALADNEKRLLAANNEARYAQDLVRMSGEQGARLMECVAKERERAIQVAADAEQLREEKRTIAERLAHRDMLLQEREKTIHELKNELHRVAADFNERNEQTTSIIAKLEREAGAALAQAEARGEAAAREGARLAADLAAARAANEDASQRLAARDLLLQAAESHIDKMKEAMNVLVQKSEDLANQLTDKNEKIHSLEELVANSKQEALILAERATISAEERERERRDYEEREAEREREHRNYEERIVTAQHELTKNGDTIEKLMCDIADMREALAQAETTIVEQITRLEQERSDNEKRIVAFESALAEYDDAFSRLKDNVAVEQKARAQKDAALAKVTAERERERRDFEERATDAQHELERERRDFEERATDAQREIIERNETITRMKRDLAEEAEARARADAALAESERERSDFEERAATAQRELIERNDTIANVRSDLAVEKEARARAEAALVSTRTELNTTREDAGRFLDDVRHLKADARRKDDEASKQMKIILSLKSEKEQMQEKIKELKNTISNIQEMTSKTPPRAGAGARAGASSRREPPEHDDNAVPAPPTPFRPVQPSRASRASTPVPAHLSSQNLEPNTNVYNMIFSDSSSFDTGLWDNACNSVEMDRRFDALALDTPPAPLKRRHGNQIPASEPSLAPTSGAASAQQTQRPARKFFKTRRIDRSTK